MTESSESAEGEPTSQITFLFKADMTLEAVDIEDAMRKIGQHFTTLANGEDLPEEIFSEGEINLEPLEDWKKRQQWRLGFEGAPRRRPGLRGEKE